MVDGKNIRGVLIHEPAAQREERAPASPAVASTVDSA
jgi:hypothetical protein